MGPNEGGSFRFGLNSPGHDDSNPFRIARRCYLPPSRGSPMSDARGGNGEPYLDAESLAAVLRYHGLDGSAITTVESMRSVRS